MQPGASQMMVLAGPASSRRQRIGFATCWFRTLRQLFDGVCGEMPASPIWLSSMCFVASSFEGGLRPSGQRSDAVRAFRMNGERIQT